MPLIMIVYGVRILQLKQYRPIVSCGMAVSRFWKVAVIDDTSWFKPAANVYASRKLPSTVLDEDAKVFSKMPGREDAGGGVVGV